MSGANVAMGALAGAGAGSFLGPIGAAAGAVVGTIAGLWGELDGSNQRRAETEEAVRRMKLKQAQYLGTATSRAAASGVEFGSESVQAYLTGMADQFRKESEWALKSGLTVADAQATGAWLNAGAGLVKNAGDFAKSQNWFQTPSLDVTSFSAGTTPNFGDFNLKPPDLSALKWGG